MYLEDRLGIDRFTGSVSFTTCKFTNSNSFKEAGVFYIKNDLIPTFTCTDCTFDTNYALDGDGGIFLIEAFTGTMTLTNA